MAFDSFFISPIWIVPDDEVHVISWLGSRPNHNGSGILSKIATPGPHLIVPGSKLAGWYETNQFPVYLFRHDGPRKVAPQDRSDAPSTDDFAKLELADVTLEARVSVIAQIKGNTLQEKIKHVYNLHYNAEDQDERQATERILNPYIRLVLQQHTYQEYSKHIAAGKEVQDIQISTMTPDQLLQALGLEQDGSRIKGMNTTEDIEALALGKTILEKLDNIGIELSAINIDDLELPSEVNDAKNKSAIAKAEQKADLDRETARGLVIKQQNENLLAETKGFTAAIKAGAMGSDVSEQQLFAKLAQYPILEKTLGTNAKVIFHGGGKGQDIANQVLGALEASKD
jgi:regulator of protease activity HflC (stomatin/prohibitin superfamily)